MGQYNYAGAITAIANELALAMLMGFDEPPRQPPEPSDTENIPQLAEATRRLCSSGAYVSFFLSFQNNWNNQVRL